MVKIFGIGNPLLQNDGIGIEVANALKDRFGQMVSITEIFVDEALDLIDAKDYVIIIDAVSLGGKAGELHILSFQECQEYMCAKAFCHDRNLLNALLLDYPQIQGKLIGIEVASVSYGEGLSRELKDKFQNITTQVTRQIEDVIGKLTEKEIRKEGYNA